MSYELTDQQYAHLCDVFGIEDIPLEAKRADVRARFNALRDQDETCTGGGSDK